MMQRSARAFWTTGRGEGEVRKLTLAAPGPGQLLIETLFTGVSRGSEALVFQGMVPSTEYGRMRAPFQDGDFPWPVKYGYCNVGRVIEGPVTLKGEVVFCLYPHQTHYVVASDRVCVVPDSIPPERAILAANMETALNGVWDAQVAPGDRVSVIGAGSVGCLIAWIVQHIPGCEVEILETDEKKIALLAELGLDARSPGNASLQRDVVINASASGAGLQQAIDIAGFESRVVEMSWYAEQRFELALGGSFHSQRLRLISSQVGHVSDRQRSRWPHRRRLGKALELLAHDELDRLITSESQFNDLPLTMRRLCADPEAVIFHRIRYHD